MAVLGCREHAELRMENTPCRSYRFNTVCRPRVLGAALPECIKDAVCVREDQRITASAPCQGIEYGSLEEGEAQRISCKDYSLPR